MDSAAKRRIWGWYFFDWATQPYMTLLLTFIYAPYIQELLADGERAQAVWSYGVGLAGLLVALVSPLLGAVADRSRRQGPMLLVFSVIYVLGAWGLWYAQPGAPHLLFVMLCFGAGLAATEFATIITNAMLPGLAPREEIGRLSGSGWAFGYVGGLVALVLMLTLLAENAATGRTLIGIAPLFGLDPALREGTRAVGPLTAIWYLVFMIPFLLWVRVPPPPEATSARRAIREAWPRLRASLVRLPGQRSLAAFLAASMLYRDALNGLYVVGGIYAAGVLGWSVTDVGVFGLLAAVTGAVFAWAGGRADRRFGPMAVIVPSVIVLALAAFGVSQISRTAVFGVIVDPASRVPDVAFYLVGALVGAAGGALQAASRTMMVRQADPAHLAEAFGLYALAGKATSFLAPLAIGITTHLAGSQQAGVYPLMVLFLCGLVLLLWVKPQGEPGP